MDFLIHHVNNACMLILLQMWKCMHIVLDLCLDLQYSHGSISKTLMFKVSILDREYRYRAH